MCLQNQKMQNFFPVPNEIFSLGLTDGEILVYTFLMRCEDRKTFKCHPSYATICEAIGRSKNSVKKYVQGLEKKGLIFTEPTKVNSFSAFASKAIESYITKLVIDKNGDLLSDEIRKAIKNELGPINTRVSKGLYRYAVELDTIVQILAEVYGFNPKFVEGYRKKAEGHIYKLKGKIDYAALMDPKFAEDEEDE